MTCLPLNNVMSKLLGRNVCIGAFTEIGEKVSVGESSKIGAHCFIPNAVSIGKNVFIGPGTVFCNDIFPPSHGVHWQNTIVEDHAIIGAGCVILPGIRIATCSMISAGSVLTQSTISEFCYRGNPAQSFTNQQWLAVCHKRKAEFDDLFKEGHS